MACFLVTAAEAAVVTVAAHGLERHEHQLAEQRRSAGHAVSTLAEETVIPWSRKLKWLSWLLWGGVLLLCFEHVWHGEVTPWFPFLTAASNPADTAEMLHEMATVGVTMALIVTVVWAVMVAVATLLVRRPDKSASYSAQ